MSILIENLYKKLVVPRRAIGLTACAAIIAVIIPSADAAVAQRTTTPRQSTTARVSTAARTSTASTSSSASTTTDDSDDEDYIIENKTSDFDEVLSDASISATTDRSSSALADAVAAQRAALDSQSAIATATAALSSGQNACDVGLRQCMTEKCGKDFYDCRGDTDTMWGTKLDGCRNDIEASCTGEEYRLFSAEIKADRDLNAQLASYNAVIDCGNQYNDCIITECGTTFSKCLGKAAGDAAIAKCKTIADNCKQQDSGLASRAMSVFGALRQDAEAQVQRDEQRLYEIRDEMRSQCSRLGAMLDERSLDCVFTVEFYAGDDSTLYASKKAYAGGVFDCTPNWFGIDVTTFMENAYRLTREQKSASSALMGAGLGVAAGAITSGAIDRAIDRHKADKALDEAKDEHEENYGDKSDEDTEKDTAEKEDKQTLKERRAERRAEKDAKEEAENTKEDTAKEEEEKEDKKTLKERISERRAEKEGKKAYEEHTKEVNEQVADKIKQDTAEIKAERNSQSFPGLQVQPKQLNVAPRGVATR